MIIRKAKNKDLPYILEIYSAARDFMKAAGNPNQWKNGYPTEKNIQSDINENCLYLVEENSAPVAAFYFRIGEDKTYGKIYGGNWLSDDSYAVIHRVAVKEAGKGIAGKIFDYCFNIHKSIRIDTHRDNKPMQRSLEKAGFNYCGIIHLENGEERLAFHKTK